MNRYPGIRAFEENEAQLFFGRNQETRQLLSLVKAKNLVVLFAKSGIGKSSLINAGLAPILNEDVYEPIKIRLQNTGQSPVELVKSALQIYLDENQLRQHAKSDRKEARLWEYIRSCQFNAATQEITPIIIFDQFEEFFDFPIEERNIIIEELADLLSERLPERIQAQLRSIPRRQRSPEQLEWHAPISIKVIFSIRSDKLSLMDQLSDRIPTILHNRYHLQALKYQQAKEAILTPATLEGDFDTAPFTYEDSTLDMILDYLSNKDQEIESFQLQLICQQIEREVKQRHE